MFRVSQFSFLCSVLRNTCLSFCPFSLAIALSVHLQFTGSDYSFGILQTILAMHINNHMIKKHELARQTSGHRVIDTQQKPTYFVMH